MKNKSIHSSTSLTSFDRKTGLHSESVCSNGFTEEHSNNQLKSFEENLHALSCDLSKTLEVKEAEYSTDFEQLEVQLKWCAYCGKENLAVLVSKPTAKTFWSAVGIFVSGGFLGCFLLPYLTPSCQEARTQCVKCERYI